jgi:predicted amidohydrolase
MQRRNFLKTASALTAAGLSGLTSAARAQERETESSRSSGRPSYHAAVMRVSVLVPPSEEAFEDIRRRNMEAMVEHIETAMRSEPKPRIVVFPVLQYTSARRAVSGVPMEAVAQDLVSKPLDQTIWAPVIAACRRHNCYVATSTQEKAPQLADTYFHTGFIMGPEGLVLRSPKVQAPSAPRVSYIRDIMDDYLAAFGPDSILPVVKTPVGTLACYVEGEAQVLEASRLLASKGADVILHTAMEGDDVPWRALKQAIAYQNQVYLLTGATSRMIYADDPAGQWAGGSSTIADPTGRVLAEIGGRDEGFVTAEVNLNHVDEAREEFSRDTVPAWHLYTDLYQAR